MNVTSPAALVVWMPRRNVARRLRSVLRVVAGRVQCQISTSAFATAAQALLTLTTLMVSVSGVPCRFSRMSLRNKSVRDGYGPIVSVGVTAQLAFVLVVVVPVEVVDDGLVGDRRTPAATAAPRRRRSLRTPRAG